MKQIVLLLILATATVCNSADLTVIEKPQASAPLVAFQAIVRANLEGADDMAAWDILAQAIFEGSEDYSAQEIITIGSQAGILPSAVSMPGYMRLEMASPAPAAFDVGRVFAQCIVSPKLREATIETARSRVVSRNTRPFDRALRLHVLNYEQVTTAQVQELYKRVFRPENITVLISGNFEIGVLTDSIRRETRRWEPGPKPRPGRLQPMPPLPTDSGSKVASFELRADVMTPSSPYAAARLLAVMALGVAKDCTMFRVLREREGLSYVQEAVLWPSKEGWIPRFIMLRQNGKLEDLAEFRKLLVDDVDSWTDQTLRRAVILGQASLRDGLAWSPIYLGTGRPMASNLVDRAALFSYLDMVGTGGVTAEVWAQTLENVDLETLKTQAKEMLDKSNGIFLPPQP